MDRLEIWQLDGERGLRLAGELDLHSAKRLTETLGALQGAGKATLDLSALTFIDSSGLHALVAFARTENGNGPVILQGVSAMMLRMFEITNLVQHPGLEIMMSTDGE
jgi:anti-sigma B factor antagonist